MRQARNSGKREALIAIMNRAYEEIRDIEAEHGIQVDDNDFRPRIEYFHDAVRAISHAPDSMHVYGRLSVEQLAYDLSCLRYLQERPLAKFRHENPLPVPSGRAPAGTLLLQGGETTMTRSIGKPKPVSPATRSDIALFYKNYTVMFAALFAEAADMNFQSRTSQHNSTVEELAQVEQMLKMLDQGRVTEAQVEETIQYVENEALRNRLTAMLKQRQGKKEKVAAMWQFIRQQIAGIDQQIATLDKAHMSFLSGQMMLYQESRDMVKKLAAQGMNLAGQYLESAMQQAGRGAGRDM